MRLPPGAYAPSLLASQARSGAALLYRTSADRSQLVLFGGYDGMVELDDMWMIDLGPTTRMGWRWQGDDGYGECACNAWRSDGAYTCGPPDYRTDPGCNANSATQNMSTLVWTRLTPANADVAFLPGPRDSMVVGRTIPYNSFFLWGGEDNAVTFSTCWEFTFRPTVKKDEPDGLWHLLELMPNMPQPPPRASSCSAISDDNEIFMFSGRPLDTPTRGPLGAPAWSKCPFW